MREKNDPFRELKRLIQQNPERVTILEEEIDIKLQMEYYKLTREAKSIVDTYNLDQVVAEVFAPMVDVADKKKKLILLASFNDVSAFRAIERYQENPDPGLEKWAILAYQESRMLISSQLLDDVPVFISTGLGGKGRKLRYSIAMANSQGDSFSEFQQKIILSEMEFIFKSQKSDIETTDFKSNIVLFSVLIPLEVDVRELLNKSIRAINQFGSFMKESFMITNMQKITVEQMEAELREGSSSFGSDVDEIMNRDEE